MKYLPLLLMLPLVAHGAKVAEIKVVDEQYLMIRVLDGQVDLVENLDLIDRPFGNIASNSSAFDVVTRHDPALDTAAAQTVGSWRITSQDDPGYGTTGRAPEAVHRRTKLNGMAVREWVNNDFRYDVTFEHWLFLRLPTPMRQGARYTVTAERATNLDRTSLPITFDAFTSRSEAVRVNLAGYTSTGGIKAADLYMWLGDGGARDYSTFQGRRVVLHNVATRANTPVGEVRFWKPSGTDAGGWNYTQSNVWNVDFTGFDTPGTYRLVVEGVGCSEDFEIQPLARKVPFDVAVQGYFFMRIGQPRVPSIRAVPRQPLYIQGQDPENTRIVLTSMHPLHPEWKTFSSGDAWDKPADWERFQLPGAPTNANARGGYSDALDWDRHLAHVSDIYDILLPYILTNGVLNDDNTGIAESGNGIPDILDSARFGVDFFLSLKTEAGYGHGLTNPTRDNVLYQAGPTAISAWANAANAAMLAEGFRISGHSELMRQYTAAAVEAYAFASRQPDPMLDVQYDIGWVNPRGRDFRMMAAAFLFNVTGERTYEEVIAADSVVRESADHGLSTGTHEQLHASAAYLLTPREPRHPAIQRNMRTAILREARTLEAEFTTSRPSRRAAAHDPCWFQTAQHCQRTILAHRVATTEEDRRFLRDALILEADWGLGRNPANMIQMTTATTPLENRRSVILCYTSGQFDGVPGLHPGHTPYMNVANWGDGMIMARPRWMADQSYPAWESWPHAEGHFETRHVYSNGEFTPRQTMRGKFAIYAYLLALERHAAAAR